jgi:hypothetical protein
MAEIGGLLDAPVKLIPVTRVDPPTTGVIRNPAGDVTVKACDCPSSVKYFVLVKSQRLAYETEPAGIFMVSPLLMLERHAWIAAQLVEAGTQSAAKAGRQKIAHPTKVVSTRRFWNDKFIEYPRTIPQKRES